MTVQITRENFTAAMRAAVAERGEDWVYPAEGSELAEQGWRSEEGQECVYVLPDGSPACLIGLALYKIDPALVEGLEGDVATALRLFQRLGVEDGRLYGAAQDAQDAQDSGVTWGNALKIYERALNARGETQ